MDLDSVLIHIHAKKELGQYSAILISHLVNNPYFMYTDSCTCLDHSSFKKCAKMSNYDVIFDDVTYTWSLKFIISYHKIHHSNGHDQWHNVQKTVSQYEKYFFGFITIKDISVPTRNYIVYLKSVLLVYFLQFSLKNATNSVK